MKRTIILATAAMMAFSAPAMAGGHGLSVGLGVSSGKGGILGTVLGGHNRRGGNNGIAAIVDVSTGKGGILGALLGSRGKSGHGRRGGHCGCR